MVVTTQALSTRNIIYSVAQDIKVVMESIPDLLDLKRRLLPRQVPSSEVRLAKG
jgi:hypothetical protein